MFRNVAARIALSGLCAILCASCSSPSAVSEPDTAHDNTTTVAPALTQTAATPAPMDLIGAAATSNELFTTSDGSGGDADSTAPPEVVAGIKDALITFGDGCVAPDIEAAMGVVSEDFAMEDATEILDKAGLRATMIERLVYGTDSATGYVLDNVVITLDGEKATAKPFVLERVSGKNVWFEFELREEFGAWRITGFFVTSGVE